MKSSSITELDPVSVEDDEHGEEVVIRTFRLELNGVVVELCSLGASITRLLVPTSSSNGEDQATDVVLGFKDVHEMWESQNPPYFAVVPGRVANRIKKGRFRTAKDGKQYQVDINNPPNHLHGGSVGFSRRIWNAEVLDDEDEDSETSRAVRFTFSSVDGDQHYPGTVQVSATYSLKATPSTNVIRICLDLEADLIDDSSPTPVSLTQHSYFNLAGHDDPQGVLDHTLRLYCDAYTPVDETSIPTREVRKLAEDKAMDWRSDRSVRRALQEYGAEKTGLPLEQVQADISDRSAALSGTPYGFDHNYVVRQEPESNAEPSLSLVGVLQHSTSGRRLTVRSTAPGVQLYTANYLDGTVPRLSRYSRWQGLCLETQHFPDSILVDTSEHPEFAEGQCPILSSDAPHYHQSIEYTLEHVQPVKGDMEPLTTSGFHGTDLEGNRYDSVNEMWQDLGVDCNVRATNRSWYECAASHYEENCPATIDGVLGGFASVSEMDVEGSLKFLRELEWVRPTFRQWTCTASSSAKNSNAPCYRACECGAGLGRVTKDVLSQLNSLFRFDLVESSSKLLSAAPDYLGNELSSRCRYFCTGLENWEPVPHTYAVIWIQWVLSYLTDQDIIKFLRRCGQSLVQNGIIVLKENICADSDFEVDTDDASVTRSSRYWKYLLQQAGLRIVHHKQQEGLSDDIYPVFQLALEVAT